MISSARLRSATAAAIGFAVSTAHPLGIASSILMPALALSQPTRRTSCTAALSYYGATLWPIIPGAKNFLGPDVSLLPALALWAAAIVALASVWPIMWSADTRQAIWRAPVGLLLTVIPPLGIIGFASPLTAAGFLFPGCAWCGLFACGVISGSLRVWPRRTGAVLIAAGVIANALHPGDPEPLPGWQGVDTNFGSIAHAPVNPISEYQAAQWIQQFSLTANARVVVFPETVVPTWTAATEAFWQQTLDRLRASGKTILVGARVPITRERPQDGRYDFTVDLVALRGDHSSSFQMARPSDDYGAGFSYDNAVIIRGAETGEFVQRIPVPIAMWNPFHSHSARLTLFAPPVIAIAGERAAVLVCYEQLVTWPVLISLGHRPTILIAVANDHWASETRIPAFQVAAIRAWSRLFGVPAITATNR